MRRYWMVLGLAVVGVVRAYGEEGATISMVERKAALERLERSRADFMATVRGLSDAQLAFKPGPERWSVAEVGEHLILIENAIPQLIQKQLLKTPRVETVASERDERLAKGLVDRSRTAKAPDLAVPQGRFHTAGEIAEAFGKARAATIAYVEATQDDLRHHQLPHPALGALDGYQWIIFMAEHTERHILQMKEVMESEGFPKE